MAKTLAVYDFDNTLIRGDSLWHFVAALRGAPLAALLAAAGFITAMFTREFYPDYKGAMKRQWLGLALRGQTLDACRQAAHIVRVQLRWKADVVKTLEKHAAEGADIVIATGALNTYIGTLLEGVPYHIILCTSMEQAGGKLTGRLATPNAVRAEKARLVAAYIKQRGPFDRISGYGNLPSDRQMLALCDDAFVI